MLFAGSLQSVEVMLIYNACLDLNAMMLSTPVLSVQLFVGMEHFLTFRLLTKAHAVTHLSFFYSNWTET